MSYISPELRHEVIDRAGGCCEYCLIDQREKWSRFEIDHIIAEKHGGGTESENLCLSCYECNSFKGSDIASIDWETDANAIARLYNPRTQDWHDHFRLNGAMIEPLTPEGRVTVFLLRFNDSSRVIEREMMLDLGGYPCK